MIRELFHWIWMFVKAFITFHWGQLPYHAQNLWWYLIYGYTYYDIQDTDDAIMARLCNMVEKLEQHTLGVPDGMTEVVYHQKLRALVNTGREIISNDFGLKGVPYQMRKKAKFFALFRELFFTLWF